MDECRAQRQSLAEEFKALQSSFVALGDETRQQIFIALLELLRRRQPGQMERDQGAGGSCVPGGTGRRTGPLPPFGIMKG